MKKGLFVLFLLLLSKVGFADILVEVHGYLGSAASWERSGVNAVLTQNGWQRAGILRSERVGIVYIRDPYYQKGKAKQIIFNTDLPSQAPLWVQSDQLIAMIKWINKTYPNEKIHLVGHSAGGVVARLSLLNPQVKNIASLITIAAPHMGTYRAAEALDFSNDHFPINIIKDFLTGGLHNVLRHSTGLLIDLLPPRPGSTLALINMQKHPENIRYVSVVRTLPVGLTGDAIVPGLSQDMNSVPALAGRSEVFYTHTNHGLVLGDGELLLDILKGNAGKN